MPPPVPRCRWSSAIQNVRMATLRSPARRSASTQPIAPQYTPRSTGSSAAMCVERGQLRRTGDRAGRERGLDGVGPPEPGPQPALDGADQVDEARVPPRASSSAGTLDRAPVAHPPEVVADEVDDHHVLGPVLRQQQVGRRGGALDRRGRHGGRRARQEPLGRRGGDVHARGRGCAPPR